MFQYLFRPADPPEIAAICYAIKISKRLARRILFRFDSKRYAEVTDLLLAHTDEGFRHDPIEDLPEMLKVLSQADAETDLQLKTVNRGMGYCHVFWRTKQRILKKKYNFDWISPGEMNPHTDFD